MSEAEPKRRRRLDRSRRQARRGLMALRRNVPFGGDRFRLGLEDYSAPISSDLASRSSTLLLAFGGMKGKLDIPPFEFFSLTEGMPVKRVFVRDLRQAWYHRGVPRHGGTITAVAADLERLIERQGVDRLVIAGTSAGGYAALLFGTLLGAETVLSFGPQTVIDLGALEEIGDHRWDERLLPLTAAGALQEDWTDLRTALPGKARVATRHQIYFDASFPLDRLHAERLADVEGVALHGVEGGDHRVAQKMRQTGQLQAVLREALGVPVATAATSRPARG